MPRLPRLTVPAFEQLAAQLRYTPAEAVRRAIERAEQLAGDIDPQGQYPPEWVIYRVTRYRPDNAAADSTSTIPGEAILADLSAFVERLCDAASIQEAELLPETNSDSTQNTSSAFITADELSRRWNISRKTIDRLRRKGLIARRVVGHRGKVKVLFSSAVADAFGHRNSALIERAAGFSRIDADIEARIVRRAIRYRRRFGCSLNEAAKRLSERFDRSHEAIRQLLQRHEKQQRLLPGADGKQAGGVFGDDRPLGARDRRLAYRAYRRAIEPSEIAKRLSHRKQAITRGVLLERLDRLRGMLPDLEGHVGPLFARADAERVLLSPAPVRQGLGRPAAPDLASLLAAARVRIVPVGTEEMARAIAYQYLTWRANGAIEKVSHLHPSASAIDRIETDLRWAARLRAELVRSQLPLMLQTIEGRLGSSVDSLRPMDAANLVMSSIAAVGEVVHIFDPFRAAGTGARLAGSVSPVITRLAAQWAREHTAPAMTQRATAVYTTSPPIPDWTANLCRWQRWVEPDGRIQRTLQRARKADRDFLIARFGWIGGPPHTLIELAKELHQTVMQTGTAERRAIRAVLQVSRRVA
ncbi:MAG: hypothetical protein IT435_17985 [Phycisphaerales bacterium]|nr:hypothetical protein [Phycisphaerales bacterium]